VPHIEVYDTVDDPVMRCISLGYWTLR